MKSILLLLLVVSSFSSKSIAATLQEIVYVKSPTDTDHDGKPDLIYASIKRPDVAHKVSTIYTITPYAMGGNADAKFHDVDVDLLPQDQPFGFLLESLMESIASFKSRLSLEMPFSTQAPSYAYISAHSLGTGYSTGCPTVGDWSETLAAKTVIDWLNGKAQAYNSQGTEVFATWANGKVAMTGVSYNGTLPIMVAATGVEGLKAIIPIAAISNWYDYYRSNGLVVNPGGYIGEDADVLGYFIYKKGTCQAELSQITREMGREHGDFSPFWQARNYLPYVSKFKAATFVIHGQSDWNVKQKNAIQLFEALQGVVPTRMFLHHSGHGSTNENNVPGKIQAWIDHFVEGANNGITSGPQVEVETLNGNFTSQNRWPHENAQPQRIYLGQSETLMTKPGDSSHVVFKDLGKNSHVEDLLKSNSEGRLIFLSSALTQDALLSGTVEAGLRLSVKNRKAANITVVLFAENQARKRTIITRGWADPQNYTNLVSGELLVPHQKINLNFKLEPKQFQIHQGDKLGVLVTATDDNFTLRPRPGTEIEVTLDQNSFVTVIGTQHF